MQVDGPRFGRVQTFLKQIVFGGNDGIVTTFAIVAGFAGARAEGAAEIGAIAVLVFGLANLFADGVSMGLGEFLSLRSKHDLYHSRHSDTLRAIARDTPSARDRLAELNVVEGVLRVSETPILQRAWARGAPIAVHGLIYGLKDGLLRNLDCTVARGRKQKEAAE